MITIKKSYHYFELYEKLMHEDDEQPLKEVKNDDQIEQCQVHDDDDWY
jgi:hypothetical protein